MTKAQEAKERIVELMIKPALRYCLRNSIGVKRLIEMVQSMLVDLCAEELQDAGQKVTVSRIAVMSGMSRRDVTRIYKDGEVKKAQPKLIHRVINRWEQHPEFLTKAKKPRVLSYAGEDSEFKQLCKMVSKDINPRTMLDELRRLGLIEDAPRGIRLVERVEMVHKDPKEGLELLALDTETLSAAIEENIFEQRDTRNLHIRTEYDNIFKEDVPAIRQWIFEKGQLFHRQVREYLSLHDQDINADENKRGGARVVVGAFSWTDGGALEEQDIH